MRHSKKILSLLILVVMSLCGAKNVFADIDDTASTYTLDKCREESGDANAGGNWWACAQCVAAPGFAAFGSIWFNNVINGPDYWGFRTTGPASPVYFYTKFNQCGTNASQLTVNSISLTNQANKEVDYIAKLNPADTLYTGVLGVNGRFMWSMPGNSLSSTFKVTDMFYEDVLEQQRLYQEDPSAPDGYWWCIHSGYNGAWGLNVVITGYNITSAQWQWLGNIPIIYDPCNTASTGQSWARDQSTPEMAFACCTDENKDGVCDTGGDIPGGDPSGPGGDPSGPDGPNPPTPSTGLCDQWKSSTQANSASSNLGTTSVIAAARNNGLKSPNWVQAIGNYGSDGDNDSKPIYAKPGDRIDFQNCYYGGEQKVANTQATYADDSDSCGYKAPKTAMKNIYDFDHGLSIESENFGADNDRNYFKDDDYNIGDSNTKSYSNSYTIDKFDVLDSYIYETDETTGITYAQAYSPETHTWVCKATCTCKAPDCGSCRTGLYDGLRLAGSQSCSGDETPAMAAISLSGLAEKSDISLVYLDGDGVSPGDDPHEDDWCECSDGCEERIKHCCGGEDSEDGWDESYECIQKRQESSHQVVPSDADDSEVGATVTITVPYNFINTGTISLGETSSSIAYAGEDIKINTTLRVNTRENITTNGTYATIEEDSDVRIYTYSSTSGTGSAKLGVGNYGLDICSQLPYNRGNCNRVNSYDGRLNENGNMSGATYNHSDLFGSDNTYNIYDIPAGEYFCAVTAIFPYTTNGDTDVDMMSYDHRWYISKPACKVVNKKPSFQIWGGSVYSSGNIKAQYAAKNVLNNYIGYTAQNRSNKTIFGSWGEYAVIPNTSNNFLSSGAATGYTTDNNGSLIFNPGGNKTGTSGIYCKNSPLTIMNKGCSGNSIPENANITADTSSKTEIYNSLAVPAKTTPVRPAGTRLNLSDANNYTILDKPYTRYTYVQGDAYVYASQVMPTGVTHVVYATGNIILGTGLQYSEGPYTDLSQVPQYVFYADKDIDIEYNVGRVDGWLISGETINTCTDGTALVGVSDSRSNLQLKINGAVVAKKINLNRTYGASTGNTSGIPAEIINLNITHFLWSGSTTSSTPTLRTVYTKELAPRY